MTREHHACAIVLGLDPSVAGYAACVGSLHQSLDQARPSAQDGNEAAACADVGLGPTDPGFAQCAADLRATLWNQELLGPR